MTSQITGISIVWSTVCSGADKKKHRSSASLAFVRGIHRWPWWYFLRPIPIIVNKSHKKWISIKNESKYKIPEKFIWKCWIQDYQPFIQTSMCVDICERLHKANSIQICHFTSTGNPTVEIRRYYDRLISTMWLLVLLKATSLYSVRLLVYFAGADHARLSAGTSGSDEVYAGTEAAL